MQASLQSYVNLLGFENASWGNNEFTHVSRDSAGIYLCQGDQGRTAGRGFGSAWKTPQSSTRNAELAE